MFEELLPLGSGSRDWDGVWWILQVGFWERVRDGIFFPKRIPVAER